MQIVLASISPRRRELLSGIVDSFELATSKFDEINADPYAPFTVVRNAIGKASDVARGCPDDLVIGADTVIEFAGAVLGKPETLNDAHEMLAHLSGQSHSVTTAVCLLRRKGDFRCIFCETTQVTFRALTDAMISEYLKEVNPLDKAGAYGIQERGELIVDHIDGPLDNVVGLPCEKLRLALQSCGMGRIIVKDIPSLQS